MYFLTSLSVSLHVIIKNNEENLSESHHLQLRAVAAPELCVDQSGFYHLVFQSKRIKKEKL